jgi:hypothetical protein
MGTSDLDGIWISCFVGRRGGFDSDSRYVAEISEPRNAFHTRYIVAVCPQYIYVEVLSTRRSFPSLVHWMGAFFSRSRVDDNFTRATWSRDGSIPSRHGCL